MTLPVDATEVLAAREVVVGYWAIVDGRLKAPVDACFTEDAQLSIEGLEIAGRDNLVQAVRERTQQAARQGRTTRHVVSNLFVSGASDGGLILDGLITVFSGYGDPPAPLGPPSSVGDFTYHCVRAGAGEWRISRLDGKIVFAGKDSPYFRRA